MIFGHIDHIPSYISPKLQEALNYLKALDFDQLELGRNPVDGDHFFLMVAEYDTVDPKTANPEDHDHYLDIQVIYEGEESFGYKYDPQGLEISQPYDEQRDITYYHPSNLWNALSFKEKNFCIVFPKEVHVPGLHSDSGPSHIKKIVAKISMDWLNT